MAKITLDYNLAVAKRIKGGISDDELKACLGQAELGLSRLADLVKSGEVGFPNLPKQDTTTFKGIASEIRGQYNDLVVIGIGGSSLGLEAITNALLPLGYNSLSFDERGKLPRVWVLDNSDPSVASSILKYCKPKETFVLVISKSGATVETAANFTIIMDFLSKAGIDLKKQVILITDPQKGPLCEYGKANGMRMFDVDNNVGGRYSVLSPVGLLPAVILGLDIDKMLAGACSVAEGDKKRILTLAAIYIHYLKQKPIHILMPYSSKLRKFAEWFNQLYGESLGKRYDRDSKEVFYGNTTAIACGSIDQHSQLQLYMEGPNDKLVTFIGVSSFENDIKLNGELNEAYNYLTGHTLGELLNAELATTAVALSLNERPSVLLEVDRINEESLGALFMLFEYVVAIVGLAANINPFDQPAVELGKQFAYGLMGRKGYEAKKAEFTQLNAKSEEHII
ncbi:glucose-6-phosphate isomerase [Deferribacterales bacterium RsTz2092]|nr:glucose-6-phosphate isomerase [Deferribacterales bacterium]